MSRCDEPGREQLRLPIVSTLVRGFSLSGIAASRDAAGSEHALPETQQFVGLVGDPHAAVLGGALDRALLQAGRDTSRPRRREGGTGETAERRERSSIARYPLNEAIFLSIRLPIADHHEAREDHRVPDARVPERGHVGRVHQRHDDAP